MSAEVILKDAVIWVVHGINFHVDIMLDGHDAECDDEAQVYEAASRALMVFKGLKDWGELEMDSDEDVPLLGVSMIVHRADQPPSSGYAAPTHIVLANQGFYAESVEMEKNFISELSVDENGKKE